MRQHIVAVVAFEFAVVALVVETSLAGIRKLPMVSLLYPLSVSPHIVVLE